MTNREIAWILVRCAGLWMLIRALMVLPQLITVLPVVAQLFVSWDMIADTSWTELLSRGTVANAFTIISKAAIYFPATAWLLTKSEGLIRLIEKCQGYQLS